ncbi:trypsin-like peptidase domain-containing protein [Betaproteobacteria bacterium]|nr:trypsin-like peptidase domain-containing protein [Betaproteobacteria bacterium]
MSSKSPWLIFCQLLIVSVGLLFIISTLKPLWFKSVIDKFEMRYPKGANPDFSESPIVQRISRDENPNYKFGFTEAAVSAMPSVVPILTKQNNTVSSHPFFMDPLFEVFFFEPESFLKDSKKTHYQCLGSGVIVAKGGFVMTNYHVIKGVTELEIALTDGEKKPAKVVGIDPETDLAVIKVSDSTIPNIIFAVPNQINIGEFVLAIGNPFGVGQTVTQGIVSALGRDSLNLNTFENFIQTDAAINPGNSGGALVNGAGELIGINTAIYSQMGNNIGIGFAIPIETVTSVLTKILNAGKVNRGFVGIQPADISSEYLGKEGEFYTYVRSVLTNSPAYRAGVRPGDIILAIGGLRIRNSKHFLKTVANLKPFSKTNLKLRRGEGTIEVRISIVERPIFN